MLKVLFLLALITPVGLTFNNQPIKKASSNQDAFVVENNARGNFTITGVKSSYINNKELRVYNDENRLIDEISDTAFDSCLNLEKLMLSNVVTNITSKALDDVEQLNYTGSEEEFNSLSITFEGTVNFYACDEGFINYWNRNIRIDKNTSICDISEEKYNEVYKLYSRLSYKDRTSVDEYKDLADETIKNSMNELIDLFGKKNPSRSKDEFTQDNAIGVIIVIALIGMTSICVFYLLKTKEVIS